MTTVLVVDDERQIRRALKLNFTARGYQVVEASTGEEALTAVARARPDVVLLDLGLPGMSGITVIEALRGWTTVPIIVLTARDDEPSKVLALELGADDYVTKPFGMAELVARVRAALRRSPEATGDLAAIETPQFTLDLAAHRAFVRTGRTLAGEPVADEPVADEPVEVRLTPTEWAIVTHLVRHPHHLVTYRELITAVWGPDYEPDQNLLRVHMGHIRRKLETDAARPAYFITDAGVGYRFQPSDES
jgi:two-component system KDP operon response regulator KdpE